MKTRKKKPTSPILATLTFYGSPITNTVTTAELVFHKSGRIISSKLFQAEAFGCEDIIEASIRQCESRGLKKLCVVPGIQEPEKCPDCGGPVSHTIGKLSLHMAFDYIRNGLPDDWIVPAHD